MDSIWKLGSLQRTFPSRWRRLATSLFYGKLIAWSSRLPFSFENGIEIDLNEIHKENLCRCLMCILKNQSLSNIFVCATIMPWSAVYHYHGAQLFLRPTVHHLFVIWGLKKWCKKIQRCETKILFCKDACLKKVQSWMLHKNALWLFHILRDSSE